LGIGVFPAFQRKGFGKPLLEAALAAASEIYQQVSLSVHPENPAIKLYQTLGFSQVDVRRTYSVMVKIL
jgi:ribosomal protein S18 acetylase RimI-like enzyme